MTTFPIYSVFFGFFLVLQYNSDASKHQSLDKWKETDTFTKIYTAMHYVTSIEIQAISLHVLSLFKFTDFYVDLINVPILIWWNPVLGLIGGLLDFF